MERFQLLFNRYVDKTATPAERLELQDLLQKQEYDIELKKLINSHLEEFEPAVDQLPLGSSVEVLQAVFSAIEKRTDGGPGRIIKLWPRVLAGMAAAALIFFGIYFYNYSRRSAVSGDHFAGKDIGPGSTGATLTLANGKRIKLSASSNGELAKEAGVVISKTADGKVVYKTRNTTAGKNVMNTLSTTNGETYQVQLPDGSAIWLNSASSLKYPASFAGSDNRVVELEGEAYFEITKDKKHPFIVKTVKQDVKVLGTHFNINSYKDEPVTKTTLLEGSVLIDNATLLKPGEQAVNSGTAIKVEQVDTDNAIGWKNNDFVFNGETFGEAMRKIARWYNVEIVYDHVSTDNILPGGWISRKSNISLVLKRIESTGDVHFKIEGRRVTITE